MENLFWAIWAFKQMSFKQISFEPMPYKWMSLEQDPYSQMLLEKMLQHIMNES